MGSNKVIAGVNDLATTAPDLALQWDAERNGELSPRDVACGSHRKLWWKDSLGHVWKASPNTRKQGYGCPFCSNRYTLPGFNDLKSRNPELAAEWDTDMNGLLKPENVSPSSGRRVWWKCKLGHKWASTVSNRAKGHGCPICENKQVLIGFNDLTSKYPRIAEEWDLEKNYPLTPNSVTPGSAQKVWWKDKYGHCWETAVYSRTEGRGCPYCANLKVLEGFNDLCSQNPDIAAEWDFDKNSPMTPKQLTSTSSCKVWWIDKHGHSWKTSVKNRAMGHGCPYCAGKKVLLGFNDFASQYPLLAAEWDTSKNMQLTPESVTSSSGRQVWWRCTAYGHSWRAPVCRRAYGAGCPICAGQQLLVGFNDLATRNPDIANEWDDEKNAPMTPRDVFPASKKMVWWRCSAYGHSWRAQVAHRTNGVNCPVCANKTILPGYNDLASTHPELLSSWDFDRNTVSPNEIPPGAARKIWWKCENGHHWRCTINGRLRGSNCPYCAGRIPTRTYIVP